MPPFVALTDIGDTISLFVSLLELLALGTRPGCIFGRWREQEWEDRVRKVQATQTSQMLRREAIHVFRNDFTGVRSDCSLSLVEVIMHRRFFLYCRRYVTSTPRWAEKRSEGNLCARRASVVLARLYRAVFNPGYTLCSVRCKVSTLQNASINNISPEKFGPPSSGQTNCSFQPVQLRTSSRKRSSKRNSICALHVCASVARE